MPSDHDHPPLSATPRTDALLRYGESATGCEYEYIDIEPVREMELELVAMREALLCEERIHKNTLRDLRRAKNCLFVLREHIRRIGPELATLVELSKEDSLNERQAERLT